MTKWRLDEGGADDAVDDSDIAQLRRKPGSIDVLCSQTKFTKKELRHLYRNFKEGCPLGTLNQQQFTDIFAQMFPLGKTSDCKEYAALVFNSFDQDNDGQVNFDELVRNLSTISRGTIEEKVNWIFSLYDSTESGRMTFADVYAMVRCVNAIVGRRGKRESHVDDAVVRSRAERLFKDMDKDKKGYITVERFSAWCHENEELCQSLLVFDTIL